MSRFDVVVIGSGAGGAVMAYRLARAGLKVAIIERGRREDPRTFTQNEYDMLPRLYKHGGLQATDDNRLAILQGQTVGGSTVINNAIWLRADLERLLPSWAAAGATVERKQLEDAYADLEAALSVQPVPPELMNHGTALFRDGCQKLGLPCSGLSHNREVCIGCGYCNYGCRYDRKTSMLVTFIPWAEKRGAQVFDQAHQARLVHRGDRVTHVTFIRHGRRYRIAADRVVVACGAIGSSELLLDSKIASDRPAGHGFHALGGVLVVAEGSEKLESFDKIGLCYMMNDTREYVLENFFQPPATFSVSLNGFMDEHADRMKRYAYMAMAGAMVGTQPTGRIERKEGTTRIKLRHSSEEVDALRRGMRKLSEIFLAGGAKAVYPGTYRSAMIRRSADIDAVDAMVKSSEDLLLGSAHPQGGNPMSEDPKRGVVGCDFRAHRYKNLFVADASVFPTNLWANCQATVMAMSYLAADHVMA